MRLQIPKLYKIASGGLAAACAAILLPLSAGYSTPASAALANCTSATSCGVTFTLGSTPIGSTTWVQDENGNLSLDTAPLLNNPAGLWDQGAGGALIWSGNGVTLTVNNGGQADPSITFGYVIDNDTNAAIAFTANQFLPILGLTGPIHARSTLVTSVQPDTGFVGTVVPTSGTGFIADSQDIRSVPPASLDKGVDIGGVCGPTGLSSPTACVEPEQNSFFNLDGTYDTMNVNVGFQVSPHTVGSVVGLVDQTVVPEPSTYGLLLAGLAFIGFVARRRLSA